jgi:serine/threonine protein kinase
MFSFSKTSVSKRIERAGVSVAGLLSQLLTSSEPYIAPEQYACEQYKGTSADIWSCGIIYFTMKYRSLPWRKPVKSDLHYLAFWNYRELNVGEWTLMEAERLGRASKIINEILNIDPALRADISQIKCDEWFSKIRICTEAGTDLNHGHTYVEKVN